MQLEVLRLMSSRVIEVRLRDWSSIANLQLTSKRDALRTVGSIEGTDPILQCQLKRQVRWRQRVFQRRWLRIWHWLRWLLNRQLL